MVVRRSSGFRRLDGGVFCLRSVGLFGEVEVVGFAAAREGGVGELFGKAGVGERKAESAVMPWATWQVSA